MLLYTLVINSRTLFSSFPCFNWKSPPYEILLGVVQNRIQSYAWVPLNHLRINHQTKYRHNQSIPEGQTQIAVIRKCKLILQKNFTIWKFICSNSTWKSSWMISLYCYAKLYCKVSKLLYCHILVSSKHCHHVICNSI